MTQLPHATYELSEDIATITLNRPEVGNRMSAAMTEALLHTVHEARTEERARCVILRAAGPCFAGGGDIPGYQSAIDADPALHRSDFARQVDDWHQIVSVLRDMTKPVLASIHATCFGYGLSLALAADLVIASSDANFMLPHRHIALTPDAGLSYLLPRIVGERRALEMALIGGPIDAETARQIGLVNWLTAPDELAGRTAKLARQLASGPPLALAATKALLRNALDKDWSEQLAHERESSRRSAGSEDHLEGVSAFVAKRRAAYPGR